MINIETVGSNIAKIRRKNKLTQEKLAELANISTNYIARVERGEIQNFSAINLLKIANVLDTSVDEFVESAHGQQKIKPQPYRKELIKLLNKMGHETSEKLSQSFIRTIELVQKSKQNK